MFLLRRDQKPPLRLLGLVFAVLALVLFVSQKQYGMFSKAAPSPNSGTVSKPSSQNPAHDVQIEDLEDDDYVDEKPGPVSGAHSSNGQVKPTVKGGLVPIIKETTIPSTPLDSDPSKIIVAQVHGFTVFDNLYLRNGTFFVLTNDQANFPQRPDIISEVFVQVEDETVDISDEVFQFLHTSKAKEVLGDYATMIPGTSIIIGDIPQFLDHFYHFWGEVILGAWRVYSTFALAKTGSIEALPFPPRWIMPFVDKDEGWRDRAGLNGPLMRLAFPDASVDKGDLWKDWKRAGTTLVFERSMIVSRKSSHRSPLSGQFFKMIAGTMNVTVPKNFWEPVRKSVVKNLFGYIPRVDASGKPEVPPPFLKAGDDRPVKPIVTYISRQSAGRRLLEEDHRGLVAALKELEDEGICTVRIPVMEHLTLPAQMAETTSSTIILGVHGNGLTHQIFMPPSLRSAVMEIVMPTAYTFDYEMLARNMGHKHYMIRNDTVTTFPLGTYHKGVHFPPGFHGVTIPVYGKVVADLIRLRLTQPASEVEA